MISLRTGSRQLATCGEKVERGEKQEAKRKNEASSVLVEISLQRRNIECVQDYMERVFASVNKIDISGFSCALCFSIESSRSRFTRS